MKKTLLTLAIILLCSVLHPPFSALRAQMPPNYELIKKENNRWFGEYRYNRLVKRFHRCDTTMTVDHFRCLYYGAALRGDTSYTLLQQGRQYRRLSDSLGQWHPTTQQAWWRLQMLLSAVWSSGNGSAEYPFYLSFAEDERYMNNECKDMMDEVCVVVYPEYKPKHLPRR